MDSFTKDDLKALAGERGFPRVSLYLATHRGWNDSEQDPVRLKLLLRRAEGGLAAQGLRAPDVRRLLEPGFRLVEDQLFWRDQSDGLALFITSEGVRRWRVPLSFGDKAVIGDRFHIRPLLPLLNDGVYWLLTLDQKRARLFRASRHALQEVDLPPAISRMPEALPYDETADQLQLRASPSTPRGRGGSMAPARGGGADNLRHKREIARYMEMLQRGVHQRLAADNRPLVLAGVEYLHGFYRQANSDSHLWPAGVLKDAEGISPDELRREAWKAVEAHFTAPQRSVVEKHQALTETSRASRHLPDIAVAAQERRVDSLLLAQDAADQWGRFDPAGRAVHLSRALLPGDEDLLDFCAVHTLLNGGGVFAVPMLPGGADAAAVFRY